MKKILFFIFLFFSFTTMVSAMCPPDCTDPGEGKPGEPPGGGIVPPPADPTPWGDNCSNGNFCYKCVEQVGFSGTMDVGTTEQPCFVSGTREVIAEMEADGWFCPWAHYSGKNFSIEQIRDLQAQQQAIKKKIEDSGGTASNDSDLLPLLDLFDEIEKWGFKCMGKTFICDDNDPITAKKCKELKCDVYGQCDYDAVINKCQPPGGPTLPVVDKSKNRITCWDCLNNEEAPSDYRCMHSIPNQCWWYRQYNTALRTGGYYVSSCGTSYPVCSSWYYSKDIHTGQNVNTCEEYCKGEPHQPPPPVLWGCGGCTSCFGGASAADYECKNYVNLDLPVLPGESAICNIVPTPGGGGSPACEGTNSCWPKDQCEAKCIQYYYCKSGSVPICQSGYYKSLADCQGKNDGGCFDTRAECISNCGCVGGGCGPGLVQPPKMEIGNEGMNPVSGVGETGRFHICDTRFWNIGDAVNVPKTAYFKVEISDPISAQNIDAISMGFNHKNGDNTVDDLWISVVGLAANSGSGPGILAIRGIGASDVEVTTVTENLNGSPAVLTRTMTYVVTYKNTFPDNLNFAWVSAMDSVGRTLPWTYTDKSFKAWDCEVNYSGRLYDDSAIDSGDRACLVGYTSPATDANITNLTFINVGNTGDKVSATMTDGYSFESVGSTNCLIWGKEYGTTLVGTVDDDDGIFDARIIDLTAGVGGSTSYFCLGENINTTQKVYTIDPYTTAPPEIQLDLKMTQNAGHWFQVRGGGIQTDGSIDNVAPGNNKMVIKSVGASNDDSWVLAGKNLIKGNNSDFMERNWNVESLGTVLKTKFNYNDLYYQYFVSKNIGVTETTWADIKGKTGVVFVDGDLTIDDNNSLLNPGDYLLLIVNGKVDIAQNVTNVEGIIISDGDVTTLGENNTPLLINGMIYSGGSVLFQRNFDVTHHALNNTLPATAIKYNPNLIFNMPSQIFKVLSDWRQGQ